MKHHGRHVFIWKLLAPFVRLWARLSFRFEPKPAPEGLKGPYLLISNHVTSFDPVLVSLSFREQMYFVASEHVFRQGFWSRLLIWALDPISRLKATNGADSAIAVMRRLRAGANICIFAEGSCAWDGRTDSFPPATGKLARACGATLVTYRLEGGYFTRPRWSNGNTRKGRFTGSVVGVYGKDELRAMSPEQVNELIARDIWEDAYARQREAPADYVGKNAAERLEALLCVCPKCGALDTLKSRGDRISCSCGYSVRYNERCFFEGDGVIFDNIADWKAWQDDRLRERATSDGLICRDGDVRVKELFPDHSQTELGVGELELRHDSLSFRELRLPTAEISGVGLRGTDNINLSACGRNFELSSKSGWCAYKYLVFFDMLSQRNMRKI